MSACCILAPIVIAAWPAFSAAVVAAASSLGYTVAREITRSDKSATASTQVQLELPQSELVMDRLARDQRLTVTRDGVTVTFSRDARGRAAICVDGQGHTQQQLRALGEELSGRVIQQYVYQKLMAEIQQRGFLVVENQTDEKQSIRLKVRHWEQ